MKGMKTSIFKNSTVTKMFKILILRCIDELNYQNSLLYQIFVL